MFRTDCSDGRNVHVWSMNSRFSVQIQVSRAAGAMVCAMDSLGILQAADVWEEATPHTYLNEIVRQMLLIV